MEKSYPEKVKHHLKVGDELPQRIGRYLREKHPYKTADAVAADTGISVNTVSSWLKGMSVPNGGAIGRLYYAYGLEFIAAVFPGGGMAEQALLLMRREAITAELETIDRSVADNFAMLRGRR